MVAAVFPRPLPIWCPSNTAQTPPARPTPEVVPCSRSPDDCTLAKPADILPQRERCEAKTQAVKIAKRYSRDEAEPWTILLVERSFGRQRFAPRPQFEAS